MPSHTAANKKGWAAVRALSTSALFPPAQDPRKPHSPIPHSSPNCFQPAQHVSTWELEAEKGHLSLMPFPLHSFPSLHGAPPWRGGRTPKPDARQTVVSRGLTHLHRYKRKLKEQRASPKSSPSRTVIYRGSAAISLKGKKWESAGPRRGGSEYGGVGSHLPLTTF